MLDRGMSLLVDRSPIGVYRSKADGTFTYVNQALAQLLGYTVDELMARNLMRDIEVDPAVRAQRIAEHVVIEGFEDRWRAKDGRILDIQLWGQAIATADGISYDAWVIDVTEQKRKRDELLDTASSLDQVVRQMPAVYWVTDRELRVERVGGASFQVFDAPLERLAGRTIEELHITAPGSNDPRPHHQLALSGKTTGFDTEFRGKHLAVMLSPRYAGGEIIGVIGTILDVTRSHLLERRMIDAQRAQGLGLLAGGLAHDFNNLLVAVIGSADLALRELPPGTPGRTAVERIRDTGLRAAELANQLLTVAGRGPTATTRVYPAAVVDEIVRIISPSVPPTIHIDVDVSPALALRADPGQLRQVLLNLVANARDALADAPAGAPGKSPARGRIHITAQRVIRDGRAATDEVITPNAGPYIEIAVADDGPGMTDEVRRHVFEPFFTTKEHGHGIGLAAALGIVRAHGGGVRLTSGHGLGTTFVISWPAAETAPADVTPPPPPSQRRTVLVVDDEDLVREVVARMLEDLGYTAITARDGQTALEIAGTQAVDAVLVDLTMPRMSGADLIAALHARLPNVPVILCSGAGAAGRVGPADAYLAKPFRIETLERTLAKLLSS